MTSPNLTDQIKEIVRPMWEQLVAECPEVITVEEMTFEELCNEVALSLP